MAWWSYLFGQATLTRLIEQYIEEMAMSTLSDFVENKEFQTLLVSLAAVVLTKQGYTVTDQNKTDLTNALGSAVVAVVDAWAVAETIKASKTA